eukprot:7882170-Lingulodinium_polyedra.AAC.1
MIPAFCKGDLAFHVSNSGIEKQLVKWAERGGDYDYPRSVEDLVTEEFAEFLAHVVENYHLD